MTEQDRPNPAETGGERPAGSPEATPSPPSEAQAAELAALEAMLPRVQPVPEAGCGDAGAAGSTHPTEAQKDGPESDAGE